MSLAFDEYGRPFIVLREQDTKTRIKGIDAIKVLSKFNAEKYFSRKVSRFHPQIIIRAQRIRQTISVSRSISHSNKRRRNNPIKNVSTTSSCQADGWTLQKSR